MNLTVRDHATIVPYIYVHNDDAERNGDALNIQNTLTQI